MGSLGNLIVHIGADIKDFVKGMDQAERRLKRGLGSEAIGLSQNLVKAFAGVGVGLAAIGGASIKMAADMEQSKIAFTTMLGSAEMAQSFLDSLSKFAAETPFELPGLIESSKKLLAFGFSAQQIKPMLTAIGDAVAGLGGGTAEIDRVTLAIGQMQAKGKVSAEEMNQLAELGIPGWQMLADKIGISIPEAMKRAEAGTLSASQAIPALLEGMTAKFGGMMEKQSQSLAGLWSTTKDNIGASMRVIGDTLVQTFDLKTKLAGANKWLNDFANTLKEGGIRKALEKMIPESLRTSIILVAGAITGAMVPALSLMAITGLKAVVPLLPFMAVGAAIAGLGLILAKNWENPLVKFAAFAVTMGGLIVVLTNAKLALTALSAVTKIATAVQAAFNAILSMNPIGLIVLAIGALILAGVALYKNWDTVKRVALNVWGEIKAVTLDFVAVVMTAWGKFVGFFNKAEGDRIKASAEAMRQQADNERRMIEQRNAAADGFVAQDDARSEHLQTMAYQKQKRVEASAEKERQSQEQTAATADAAAKAQEHALDVLDYRLGQVDASWEQYKAQVGDAATEANYLARQKQHLTDRIGVLNEKLNYLNGLYEASKASTGEFSDETMKLGKALSDTKTELSDMQSQFAEVSGPIADAKAKLEAANQAVQHTEDHIKRVNGYLSEAKDKFEKTSTAVKELEDSNKTAGQTIGDALGAMRDRIKDVEASMKDLDDANKEAKQGIADAFGAMKNSARDVEDQISSLRSKMRDLASVRLAGEGELGQQLEDLNQQEALIKLAINRLKQSGAGSKDSNIAALQQQLDALGLKKEEIQLRIETEIDPLRNQLKRLTDDTKELTFDQAKAAIEDAKIQIDALTVKHGEMTAEIDRLTTEYQNLVPSITGTTLSFDEAKNSLTTYKATIDANNLALADLTTQHTNMKAEYDALYTSVSDLVPKLGEANVTFDEAKTKVGEMKSLIEQNNAKLSGPDGLLALQDKQKMTVDLLTIAIGNEESVLKTLTADQAAASTALQDLRSAAASAAGTLSSIHAPTWQAPASGESGSGVEPIKMASGGVFTRPVVAGEAGPEAFTPLSWLDQRMRSISYGIAARLSGAASPADYSGSRIQSESRVTTGPAVQTGPNQVNFSVNLDGKQIAEYTLDIAGKRLRQAKRSRGSAVPALT